MSVTLHEIKQTLEKSMNAFVEDKLVTNAELNIRHVEDEVIKLYNTATNLSAHFKQYYAKHFDPDQTKQEFETHSYLAEYRAAHCNSTSQANHYGSELVDALYNKLPQEKNPEVTLVLNNIIKTLMLKMENNNADYQQGVCAATTAISNIKSSNLKAELYVIKAHASKLSASASSSKDPEVRRSEGHYAQGVLSSVELAEHMLPFKEMTAAEILDNVNFPKPDFDFSGHDVVLVCPGLKQTVLFMDALKKIESFSSTNAEVGWIASSALKRPLLGQFGRDTESIVKALMDGKRTVLNELQKNDYLTSERKSELNSMFLSTFMSIGADIKNAFKRGAIILQPEPQNHSGMSLS
jgi:hypothetical protein